MIFRPQFSPPIWTIFDDYSTENWIPSQLTDSTGNIHIFLFDYTIRQIDSFAKIFLL